jgi:phosphoserine phosphatase
MKNNNSYKLICFDLDGTLVDDTIYIWETLHDGFLTDPIKRKQACFDYFSGKISYKEWFEHDLVLLSEAGATLSSINKLLSSLSVMKGAKETLSALRTQNKKVAVVSGSIDLVVSHLFSDFEFDHLLINRIYFDKAGNIAGGLHTPYDIEKKADGLLKLCQEEQVLPSQAVFIGDNENDLWIAKQAGLSIAFNCKSEKLSDLCDVTIAQKDLQSILPYIL